VVCQNERVGFGTGSVGRSVAGDMVEGTRSGLGVWGVLMTWKEVIDGMEVGLM
jgi:hypothetical protein